MGIYAVEKLMVEARRLAAEYRRATGKPLGISAEIAEYDAARLLDLELQKSEDAAFDAIGRGKRDGKRIQIKGRAIFDESKPGHRIGQLKLEKPWDSVILVLMDDNYEPIEIYEAERDEVEQAAREAQTTNRAKRGSMTVAKFKRIGRMVWNSTDGSVVDELWSNQASAS